ncbi:MAG: hypothetical protein ACI9LY_003907 [Arenicella sp.]|jgi:hypothetical protein
MILQKNEHNKVVSGNYPLSLSNKVAIVLALLLTLSLQACSAATSPASCDLKTKLAASLQ